MFKYIWNDRSSFSNFPWCVKRPITFAWKCFHKRYRGPSWNDWRETSDGFRRVVWWSCRPNFWSKLTGFQNRFRLMCNARALSDCTQINYRAHGRLRLSLTFEGCLPFSKKIRKFRLKVKWNSNFQRWSGTAEISKTFAEPLSSFRSLEVYPGCQKFFSRWGRQNWAVKQVPEPLTPNHLLTMKSKAILSPPGEFQRADLYSRKRWRRVQFLANEFWKRWRKDYLQSLQSRQKWIATWRNLQVDDIVIVRDDNSPRNCWKIARVEETYPDDDDLVRKVRLKIADRNLDDNGLPRELATSLYRPVQKLVLLLSHEEYEDRGIPTWGAWWRTVYRLRPILRDSLVFIIFDWLVNFYRNLGEPCNGYRDFRLRDLRHRYFRSIPLCFPVVSLRI